MSRPRSKSVSRDSRVRISRGHLLQPSLAKNRYVVSWGPRLCPIIGSLSISRRNKSGKSILTNERKTTTQMRARSPSVRTARCVGSSLKLQRNHLCLPKAMS